MRGMRNISLIVIHCSATVSGQPLPNVKPPRKAVESAAQVIDRWHQERGFKRSPDAVRSFSPSLPHIGYHHVIDLDGRVINGRSIEEAGAHAQGFNANSIGICLIGGAEKTAQYTAAQWQALAKLVKEQHAKYFRAIPLQYATRARGVLANGICGHRDLSPDQNANGVSEPFEWLKTCPGFSVQEWINRGLVPLPQHVFQGAPA